MWGQLLRWLPALVINAVGPVIDVVQGRDREKLRNIKRLAEQARAGVVSYEGAIILILSEFED